MHGYAVKALLALMALNVVSMSRVRSEDLPVVRPEEVGMSAEKLAKIDAAMEESISRNRIVGGVVMVAHDGNVVLHKAYGKMDLEADKPMLPDTIVRIYSMTKAITTTAAMMLVEEGNLAVNDPVSKYLPELKDIGVAGDSTTSNSGIRLARKTMTIADLMRHTAGYSYGTSGNAVHDQAFRELKMLDKDASLAEFQAKLAKLPLLFEPGTDWHYGISTDVLGRVVEVASGQSLDTFFRERIFVPLGMRDTGFSVPDAKLDRFAANYNSDSKGTLTLGDSPQTSPYRKTPALFSGGGGLVSTASDYMRFLTMIAGGGEFKNSDGEHVRLLKPETIALMTSNQLPDGVGWIKFGTEERKGVGFGFGFNVRDEMSQWDPQGQLGEYGWGGAASTHYWVSPKDNLIVVTLEQVMPYQWLTEFKLKGLIYEAIDP